MKVLLRILTIAALASASSLYADPVNTITGMVVQKEDGRLEVHKDIRNRMPELTTRISRNDDGSVNISALASVESNDSNLYPIIFKFYINGRLFSDQIWTTQHRRDISVDVSPEVATIPFDYTVIAKIQHPNRTIPSVIEGTVFSFSFATALDCTLSLTIDGETTDYTADSVETTQTGNSSFDIMFTALDSDGDSIDVAATVNLSDDGTATSLLELSTSNGTTQVMTSGTATTEDSELVDFELESESGATSLSCF